jgi:hypothetical protein
MSDPSLSINEQKLQLEIQKLSMEVQKLTVEIPKIRRESGWRATVMPSIVSAAAVLVTAVVSFASLHNAQQSQNYDREKSDRDFALNCVVSASAIAKLVFDSSDKFDNLQSAGKINFANVVLAAYPPSVADRFLRSLAPRLAANDTASRTAFQLALSRVENEAAKQNLFPCPAVTELIPVDLASTQEGNPPAPPFEASTTPPTSPATVPTPSSSPAASGDVGSQIIAYYQVARSTDRTKAAAIAKDVANASASGPGLRFPSAGVETVSGAAVRQIEIRYYHRSQEGAAERLLELVRAATQQQGGRAVFIGNTFPNLPQDRIEVWLPPLQSGASYCYQEEDKRKPAGQRYLVLCQPTKDQCDVIRGPNTSSDVSQTACVAVDLGKAAGELISGGIHGSSYQFAPTPFSAPFPPL